MAGQDAVSSFYSSAETDRNSKLAPDDNSEKNTNKGHTMEALDIHST
jgi:hypothetical protein